MWLPKRRSCSIAFLINFFTLAFNVKRLATEATWEPMRQRVVKTV